MNKIICVFIFVVFFISCKTNDIARNGTGWSYDGNAIASVKLGSINVDKSGGYAVEREIAVLLPVLFLENKMIFAGNNADYIVDVYLSERECADAWNAKKSLSMEVFIKRNMDFEMNGGEIAEANDCILTPDAASRIITLGSKSFSSSKNLELFLRQCVKNAVFQLKNSAAWKNK
ncbi:MAG: hypothetical protein LBC53_01560 [Spirochaetaceae bacterium]|jgi:hypothetical protein|nr:hypothetical protein [Spirochaetaceae bacterium]